MKTYEVVEIISAKTKKFGMICFDSDREMSEYLRNKEGWNAGNKQYSIVAWSINNPAEYKDFSRFGYEEM